MHLAAFPTATEADLVERLRVGGKSEVSLIAEMEGQIVGQIVFSRVTFSPSLDVIAYAEFDSIAVPNKAVLSIA